MSYTGPPFHEFEERFLLSEILKVSLVPATAVLSFLRDAGVEPAWTEIALPPGRSVTSCQHAYNLLSARIPPAESRKRPYSFGEASSMLGRDIQPRPPAFVTVNDPGQAGQASPMSDDRPSKKRGRPSKLEHERRVAEAAARGEPYPKKPRKPKPPRQSMEGVEVGGLLSLETPWITSSVPVHSGGAGPTQLAPATEASLPTQTPVLTESTPGGTEAATAGATAEGSAPDTAPGGPAPMAMMATPVGTDLPDESTIAPFPSKKKTAGNAPEGAGPAFHAQHEDQRAAAEGGASHDTQMTEGSGGEERLFAGVRQHAAPGSPSLPQNRPDQPPGSGAGSSHPGSTHGFQPYHPDEQRQQ